MSETEKEMTSELKSRGNWTRKKWVMLKIWKCVESAPGQVAIIACRKVEIGTLFRYKN